MAEQKSEGFSVNGVSLWDRIPSGNLLCAQLCAQQYGLQGGFLITRMGELWCDSIPMYGYSGHLRFVDQESKTVYHCEVTRGAVGLIKTTSPLKEGKK